MSPTLRDPAVRGVLERLRALGAAEDPAAKARVRASESQLGTRIYGRERAELYRGAPIAVAPEVGELLYSLTLARGARTVVEFGGSLGFSTIHLAAALRDLGGGSVITTELDPQKAEALAANLAAAGLGDLVEIRAGDARETLRDIPKPVDLLFLDGWNDLYLEVLTLVEPALAGRALVVADMSEDDPHLVAYHERMHDREHGYATVDVPLDDGVVVSTRLARFEAPADG